MAPQVRATLSASRRLPASCQKPWEWVVMLAALFELHAWIKPLVEQIDQQVDQHGQHRQINGDGLDHREIAALDSGNHLTPEAGDGEDFFQQKRHHLLQPAQD